SSSMASEGAVLEGLNKMISFLSAKSLVAFSSALVAGPITILIPSFAKRLSFSRLTLGSDSVSYTTNSYRRLELLFKKFAFTSLNPIFNAASVDLPEDENTPVIGRRAPNLTMPPEPECSSNPLVTIWGLSTNRGSWIIDKVDDDERAVP